MTVPAPRVRRRPSAAGRVAPFLLVVALLVPLGLQFTQNWRLTGDTRDLAVRERMGVAYLRALAPMTEALVSAQTAAVSGRPVDRSELGRAVEEVAEVDARIGTELRSQERWAGLRAKIEALGDRHPTDPEAAFTAYVEVADLLLALHRKVRESAGLIHDPEPDSFFLQSAVGQDLPAAMVATGRLADFAVLASRRAADERERTLSELAALRVAALGSAAEVVTDLRAALENSESTKLGPSVLTPLDPYQRAVESMAAHSTPNGRGGLNLAELGGARTIAQSTARELAPVILGELDALLADRIDRQDLDRQLAAGVAAAAALLLAVLGGMLLVAARRSTRRDAEAHAEPQSQPRPLVPAEGGHQPEPARWGAFDAAR